MIAIALDPAFVKLAVAGNGTLAWRRLRVLREAGADVAVFSPHPTVELREAAGAALSERLPAAEDLARLHALWIADLPPEDAASLAQAARSMRLLVNVEDVPEHCDFHSVAEVRRGDLLLTISTGGAAPGLASAIRKNLEFCFGPEWASRVDEIAALRKSWRGQGVAMREAALRIEAHVTQNRWLACPRSAPPTQVVS